MTLNSEKHMALIERLWVAQQQLSDKSAEIERLKSILIRETRSEPSDKEIEGAVKLQAALRGFQARRIVGSAQLVGEASNTASGVLTGALSRGLSAATKSVCSAARTGKATGGLVGSAVGIAAGGLVHILEAGKGDSVRTNKSMPSPVSGACDDHADKEGVSAQRREITSSPTTTRYADSGVASGSEGPNAKLALVERGEKLAQLGAATDQMACKATALHDQARQLRQKQERG